MTSDEFAQSLNGLKILFSEVDRKELSEDFLQNFENGFRVSLKQEQKYNFENPILSLIQKYDCSQLEIGLITFKSAIQEDRNYYYVGNHEADELALNKKSGEIELREYGTDYTISYCSKNGAMFLDALLIFANSVAKNPFNQEENACEIALLCSNMAGGNKYYDYYKLLTGCEQ